MDQLPQDVAAERALLGAAMWSPAAIEYARRAGVTANSWHREEHRDIWAALVTLAVTDAPCDPIAVRAELERRGRLGMCGGERYLADLYAAGGGVVPQQAGYYGQIIAEKARARAGILAFTRGLQAITGPQPDFEMVRQFVTEWLEDEQSRPGIIVLPELADFLAEQEDDVYDWVIPGLLERHDRLIVTGPEGGGKALAVDTPIPTPKGWTTMGALSVGQEVFGPDGTPARIAAATSVMRRRECFRVRFSDGAQIIADAEHLWVTESLKAREAASRYGRRPEQTRKRGTDQRHKRKYLPDVVSTREIAATLRARGGHALNHGIEVCAPLQYPAQELPIGPYTLGAWLGDGTSNDATITCADPQILDEIRSEGYRVNRQHELLYRICDPAERLRRLEEGAQLVRQGSSVRRAAAHVGISREALSRHVGPRPSEWKRGVEMPGLPRAAYRTVKGRLRELGVLGDKHIPEIYLHASVDQRIALLQGLMDTDGTVSDTGAGHGRGAGRARCEFSVVNARLARDFHDLVLGLGIKAGFRSDPAVLRGERVGTRYRITFQTALPVFRLSRKATRLTPLRTRRARLRYITAVEPIPSVPVRCIQVDRPDGMYLAGRGCIPTHNSTLLRQIAVQAASGIHPVSADVFDPARVLYVDLENSERQTRRKLRPLHLAAGAFYAGQMHVLVRQEGIDLTGAEDRDWLAAAAGSVKPDLLIIGPLYKMANGDPTEEKSAKPVAVALDHLRTDLACALIIEAHAAKTMISGRRAIEPYGWSGWLRWPEFGVHLSAEGAIDHWRGQREERDWPTLLKRGGEWPWTPERDKNEALWGRVKQLRNEIGKPMSYRDLSASLGVSLWQVQRIVEDHRTEWLVINGGE